MFLVVIFLIKTTSVLKSREVYQGSGKENGLTYGNITIENLVNKDGDGDGILDWEEGLWGTDPTKKETTPGTPDSVAISNMKAEQGNAVKIKNGTNQNAEDLTQTEKFSRELFATIATLNQNGTLDQAAAEQLSASLADHIQNSSPRKVFSIFEIKIINDESVQAFKNYNSALNNIYKKYPAVNYTIMDVLQKFIIDENNVDASAIEKLDPIIKQTSKTIEGMVQASVPQSISTLHLNVINSFQRLMENISDIKLYDSDSIVALSGISNYQNNATRLESDLNSLANAINQKLRN